MLNEKEYAETTVCDTMACAARNMSNIADEMRRAAGHDPDNHVFILQAANLDKLARVTMHAVNSWPDFDEYLARCYDDHADPYDRPAKLRPPQPPRL